MGYLVILFVAWVLPALLVLIPVIANKPKTLKGLARGLRISTILFSLFVLVVHVQGWIYYKPYLNPLIALGLAALVVSIRAKMNKE